MADAFAFAAEKLCPRGMTLGAMADRLISWFFELEKDRQGNPRS